MFSFSGSRGPHGLDLPSLFGRKFQHSSSRWVANRGGLGPSTGASLPDREASLIKEEYCRRGPHPLQATSSRVRPPLVKGAGCIGPLFPEFQGWPLWFMASIALRGPQNLAPEVVPGASLHSEALSPECGRECQETGDCGPTRPVGAGRWGLLGPTAHGLLGRRHPGPRLGHMVG